MPLSPAEKQARYRERQRELGNAQGPQDGNAEPASVTEEAVTEMRGVTELLAHGRAGGMLSAEEEQAIRDHFGYAASESRTLAERDATARRMIANTGGPQSLSPTAFPYVLGRKPERWSLRPDPAKLDALHPKR